jgi:predicted permease
MDEVRLAIRRLSQHPSPAIASIVTLAGAIGATAAAWSLLSALLLHPLAVRDPETLVLVGGSTNRSASAARQTTTFIYPLYPAIRDSGAFEEVAGAWLTPWPFTIEEQRTAGPAMTSFVSASFFRVLGVDMALGRPFTDEDDRRGAPPAAVVSDTFWRTRLGADPAAIGRVLTLDGKPVTVVGVAPPRVRGLTVAGGPALYLPLETIADVAPPVVNYFATPSATSSPTAGVTIVGRLRRDQSAADAQARLAAITAVTNQTSVVSLIPINSAAIPAAARDNVAHFGRLLTATVALLLLIGCSTVGLLLLVRTEGRRAEFATCLALGATRTHLARGIALEGAVLTALAAALSPLVARWIFSAASTYQLPGGIALGALGLQFDSMALGAAAVAAILATVVIAAAGGAWGMHTDVAEALRARSGRRAARTLLLMTQAAVALALVAGTGLFARSLVAALELNARFDSGRIALASVGLSRIGYNAERAAIFYRDFTARAAANPAIADVATSVSSGGMTASGSLTIDGQRRQFPYTVDFRSVDASYFRAMRLPILSGRGFTGSDLEGSPQVGIVSESLARMIAPGASPLGRRIETMMGGRMDVEIVGVTEDLFTTVRDAEPLALYLPIAQTFTPPINRMLVLRARSSVAQARREVAALVGRLEPKLDLGRAETIDERLLRELAPQQFGLRVLGTLGAIALLLTLLGTYVLAESMAVARVRELGIRAALGATRGRLVAIIAGEAAMVIGAGLAAGLFLAWIGASTMRALLFRVQPLDPLTLGTVALLIMTLALVVSLRPALRAARVDLGALLRAE